MEGLSVSNYYIFTVHFIMEFTGMGIQTDSAKRGCLITALTVSSSTFTPELTASGSEPFLINSAFTSGW
jgi:hypothetical protein